MYRLTRLGDHRYVGDIGTMIVHDIWHPDCEGCLPSLLVRERAAVGFDPDELNQALDEGFECCSWCFDGSDPRPPARWFDQAEEGAVGERG